MSAAPRHRSQQAEREELARLLPAAAAQEISPRRHLQLKEHLMDTMTEKPPRSAKWRTLTLRAALPVGLAAALTGVLLTSLTGHPTVPTLGAAVENQSLGPVGNAAYSLQSEGDGLVRLTILDPDKVVDVPQLQHDLDRLGVRARIYAGEPGCHAAKPTTPTYSDPAAVTATNGSTADRVAYFGWDFVDEGRKHVLVIHPSGIPADLQLFIYLPFAKTDPAHGSAELQAGLMKSPTPACMPSKVFFNPLASLYPTPPQH